MGTGRKPPILKKSYRDKILPYFLTKLLNLAKYNSNEDL